MNDNDFNKQFKNMTAAVKVIVGITLAVIVAFAAVIIWAIVKLINHFL